MYMEKYDYSTQSPYKELVEELENYFSDESLSIQILAGRHNETGIIVVNGRVTPISFSWSNITNDYKKLKQYLIDSLKIERLSDKKDRLNEMYRQLLEASGVFDGTRDLSEVSYDILEHFKETIRKQKELDNKYLEKYQLLRKFFEDMEERFTNINLVMDEVRKKHDDK